MSSKQENKISFSRMLFKEEGGDAVGKYRSSSFQWPNVTWLFMVGYPLRNAEVT